MAGTSPSAQSCMWCFSFYTTIVFEGSRWNSNFQAPQKEWASALLLWASHVDNMTCFHVLLTNFCSYLFSFCLHPVLLARAASSLSLFKRASSSNWRITELKYFLVNYRAKVLFGVIHGGLGIGVTPKGCTMHRVRCIVCTIFCNFLKHC